jgi:hypothetical protein
LRERENKTSREIYRYTVYSISGQVVFLMIGGGGEDLKNRENRRREAGRDVGGMLNIKISKKKKTNAEKKMKTKMKN